MHVVFCVLNVPWLFMCMYVSVWCKTEELRYCIPPWSPDSHMQHSLFLRKPDNFQSGLSPCDFVGSCVPSAVVVWVIHFDRANPAHSFKTGLMNQSLWMSVWLFDGNISGCFICSWRMSETLECMWCPSLCFMYKPHVLLSWCLICCYMKTVLSDSRPLYYHHAAQEVTSHELIDRFRVEIKDGCMFLYSLVF